jgi:CDP-diacylglycerol pyrophosphatase
MIGLLLAWPGLLGGIALLDRHVMPPEERRAALIEMHCEIAQEQGFCPAEVVKMKSGTAVFAERPKPCQLLADN